MALLRPVEPACDPPQYVIDSVMLLNCRGIAYANPLAVGGIFWG